MQVNSHSIDQKSGEICTGQADLQPISFKSDRLLGSITELTGHTRMHAERKPKGRFAPRDYEAVLQNKGACMDNNCRKE